MNRWVIERFWNITGLGSWSGWRAWKRFPTKIERDEELDRLRRPSDFPCKKYRAGNPEAKA